MQNNALLYVFITLDMYISAEYTEAGVLDKENNAADARGFAAVAEHSFTSRIPALYVPKSFQQQDEQCGFTVQHNF